MQLVLSSLYGSTGGIPAFNRLLVRAAVEHGGAGRLRVVALTDATGPLLPPSLAERVEYLPCGGDRRLCAVEVFRALRQRRPILCGHVNLAPLGLAGAALRLRYGVIAHGTEVWSPLPWHRRLALRRAAVVTCVSDDTARRVQDVQGVLAGRCVRIITALESLPTSDATDVDSGRPLRLLSVTRLHPGEPKGIDLVLRAIAGLPQIAMQYTVIGDGADRPRLRALADGLGLGDRVRFAGRVGDAERDRALADCDLFVLPSSGEGFGIVFLEAMAWSKACLAARAGGTPEVVLDEQPGLLVEPNVAAVRAALSRLQDPSLRARLGRAGRARVVEHFTYEAFRQRAFQLFDKLGAVPSDAAVATDE